MSDQFKGWKKAPDFGNGKRGTWKKPSRFNVAFGILRNKTLDTDCRMLLLLFYSRCRVNCLQCSPPRDWILDQTGWGKGKFYEVRKRLLERTDLIRAEERRHAHGGETTVYVLFPSPEIGTSSVRKPVHHDDTGTTYLVEEDTPAFASSRKTP